MTPIAEKKLGFGMMRLPVLDVADNNAVDQTALCKMVDSFMEKGFTYFDTATPYHGSNSETAFRECVAKRYPRQAFTITDKLSVFMIQKAEEIPGFFEAQMERCGVEFFDYYLLHSLTKEFYEKAKDLEAFEFVAQKKAEGKVKHIGFSFHDTADVLDKILTEHPEMEYVQLQINYADWDDPDVQSRKCYEVCVKHNKPVIVMEPVKGGLLANVPAEAEALLKDAAPEMSAASWAVRFAASLDNVVMVLSGMSSEEQMLDNLSYMMDFQPLAEEDRELVLRVSDIIRAKEKIPCTACRYCVDGCPKKIAIPNWFKLVNNISKFGEAEAAHSRMLYHSNVEHFGFGKASDCVGCGQCEAHCPQHLPVREYLKDVEKAFE